MEQNRKYITTVEANTMFLQLPWWLWGIVCLIVTGIYTVVYPHDETGKRPVWRKLILRWFHALVWVLLSVSCFMRSRGMSADLANVVGSLSLVCYAIFMVTMLMELGTNSPAED